MAAVNPGPGPSFLVNLSRRLLLFGGKGGVGKTTLAAAAALDWAGHPGIARVLVVSTDPAHSLGDSFEQLIGDQITDIAGAPGLFALEIDAASRLEEFKRQYGDTLQLIFDRGTYFDRQDIADFFDLSLPGLDELMAVIEIARLVREKNFDLVVVDTAPTGHTLRLLALPALMEHWLHVLDLMLEKYRYMAGVFGHYRPDQTDAFIVKMRADLHLLEAVLGDPEATEFVPVMIPEAMSIAETLRLIDSLDAQSIHVETVVVNRVLPEGECAFCEQRRAGQIPHLQEIATRMAPRKILHLPQLSQQVRGLEALRQMAGRLRCEPDGRAAALARSCSSAPKEVSPAYSLGGLAETRLLLFGGKGGVGKTTLATATAIYLAEHIDLPDSKRTLLFSTDPAHSLSDSLNQPIGNQITEVRGVPQLFALEMNSEQLLEELNQAYVAEVNEVFDAFLNGGYTIEFDQQVMEELISLTPPGIDELMALMKIMDFIEEGKFERFVLDFAPTGHALRFLETPGMVRKWLVTFFKLLLKYQHLAPLSKVSDLLRQKSKQLRLVHHLLADPQQCQFIAVTIPEAMAVLETKRFMQRLGELSVPTHLVITNMVMPQNSCPFCGLVRSAQQPYLDEIETAFPDSIQSMLSAQEIQGLEQLERTGELLYKERQGV